MLVVAEYVPVVRWFRENEKNKGAGFKIKPESFTCLKDPVQKEIAFQIVLEIPVRTKMPRTPTRGP